MLDTLIGERVRVHVNLHKGCLSVTDPRTRKVIGYADSITIADVTFTVSEKARLRVVDKQCREVHAWAVGRLEAVNDTTAAPDAPVVSYNPYRAPTFTSNGEPVLTAPRVTFWQRKGYLP